jgi:hypothetical protein
MDDLATSDNSIGSAIIGQRSAPSVQQRGRVCAEPGCRTRLSIYNQNRFCSLHTECPTCKQRNHRRRGTSVTPEGAGPLSAQG